MAKTYSNLDIYKEYLGHGFRTNKFKIVFGEFPTAVKELLTTYKMESEDIGIMIHHIDFPQPRDLNTQRIFFNGSYISVALDKKDFNPEFSIKFYDAQDRFIFDFFETWINLIQTQYNNKITDYQSNQLEVDVYDFTKQNITDVYIFQNYYPIRIESARSANYKEKDPIENTVTFTCESYSRGIKK